MKESTFLNPTTVVEAAKIRDGMVVVDFGAGSGFFTRAAAREVGQGEVWAVDINQDLLPRIVNVAAGEGLRNVHVVQGDIEKQGGSNLPDAHADLVIVANVLFSLEDKEEMVKELVRVLKRGGRALVVDWKDSFGGLGPHPDHVITVGMARDLFEKGGLQYLEDVPAGQYHWGFIVRKKVS